MRQQTEVVVARPSLGVSSAAAHIRPDQPAGGHSTETLPLAQYGEQFLAHCRVSGRSLSPRTQASYRGVLAQLFAFTAHRCAKEVDALLVTDLDVAGINAFVGALEAGQSCHAKTLNHRLSCIRSLARYIGAHDHVHADWSARIRAIPGRRASPRCPDWLTPSQMAALLAASGVLHGPQGREHALLHFLYNTGARMREACALKIGDVDWQAQVVALPTPSGGARRCPLWPETVEALRRCAGTRAPSAPLFCNRRGETLSEFRMHELFKRFITDAIGAGVPTLAGKKVTAHVVRRSAACHMLQTGMDVGTVVARLGLARDDTLLCMTGAARTRQRGRPPAARSAGAARSEVIGTPLPACTQDRGREIATGSTPHPRGNT